MKILNKKYFLLLVFALVLLFFSSNNYENEKKNYTFELDKQLKGIVTDKYRIEKNNPKAVNIKINDTTVYYLPFSLISEVSNGDTIIKEKGSDLYWFYTKEKIIKARIPKPNFCGYPKNWRGEIEIINR